MPRRGTPEHYLHLSPEELKKLKDEAAHAAYKRREACGCLNCRDKKDKDDWKLAEQIYGNGQ